MIIDKEIQKEIEKVVLSKNQDYIQTILNLCEKYNIDPEYMAKYLSKPVIEKLRQEGESLNLLPRSSRLPV
jgi:replication initiation and membrane attachment protein DnaB